MTTQIDALLAELEQFGRHNDDTVAERPRRMLNITRDTGEFLAVMVRAMGARRVLEVGTSNGYSTLWLARAAQAVGGKVTSVEYADFKVALAARNFARAGLAAAIDQVHGDAGPFLEAGAAGAFDLVFLDSERAQYVAWWPHIRRIVRSGGLLVVDNATSHAGEIAAFAALVRADPGFISCVVPVGNGEFLATKVS